LALGNTVTASPTNAPVFVASDNSGKPGVRFNGQGLVNSATNVGNSVNADFSFIYVASTSNPGAQQYAVWLGSGGTAANRGLGYYASQEIVDTSYNYALGASTPAANTFNPTKTQATFYQNGQPSPNSPVSVGGWSNVMGGVLEIGAHSGGNFTWQGDICEVLVYDHQLTANEFQQVGTYLANKYNSPFPNIATPTISPVAGTYTGSTQVTLTPPVPGASI
jgi:hypothetical protein